ncbi:MAG: TPM domain-containing protein [Spirochaetaceae bacterium]|nr:TPM domain-containing protein [Spirochaetaceae bacterium]
MPFHAENKPHVVDQAGLFTQEEQAELARRADEISAAYGTDCLILTTDKTIRGGTLDAYIKDFIKYNGYGEGENNDTFVFCIKKNERFTSWYRLYSTVSEAKRSCYKQKNFDNILEHADFDMKIEYFFGAATTVLDYAEKMYLKGWVLPKINYLMPVIVGIILGLIIAKARTSINKSALSNVRTATGADDYYVDGSFHLGVTEDNFLTTNTTRRKIVHETSSSYSSSSSGRSSYHSSYKSSTGRSHSSGGGRKF